MLQNDLINHIDLIVLYISMIDHELIMKTVSLMNKRNIKHIRMYIMKIIQQIMRTLLRKKRNTKLIY